MRIILLTCLFVLSIPAVAQPSDTLSDNASPSDVLPSDLGHAYVAVCEKIQQCARIEFSLATIPVTHAEVLEQALDGLCEGVYQRVERLSLYPVLQPQAVACGESLLLLSCDALANDRNTDACAALIDHANKLGLILH